MKLVIAEKEQAAKAIANALGSPSILRANVDVEVRVAGSTRTKRFSFTYFKSGDYIIFPAKGHLLEPIPKGISRAKLDDLPITKVRWKYKDLESKVRIKVIRELFWNADEVIVATDPDREGEAIGYNICKRALGLKIGEYRRAYFDALTKRYIVSAFSNLTEQREYLVVRGLARSIADSIIGLNVTKAYTLIMKDIYPELIQALSLGRVQSPLLSYVVKASKPTIKFDYECKHVEHTKEVAYIVLPSGKHYKLDFVPRGDALEVIDVINRCPTVITQSMPLPNTSDLEMELGRHINPDELKNEHLERMWLKGYITYHRTSSRWMPREDLADVFNTLSKYFNSIFSNKTPNLKVDYSKSLTEPKVEGKKAIMLTPEGIDAYFNGEMDRAEEVIASYLIDRMIKTFAPPIKVRSIDIIVTDGYTNYTITWNREVVNKDDVITTSISEVKMPFIPKIGDRFKVIKIEEVSYEGRVRGNVYARINVLSEYDMVRWLKNKGLGTDATRHMFPSILKERKYTTMSNVPTIIGEHVSKVIEEIGLNYKLTAKIERRIDRMNKLSELNSFVNWISKITKTFIEKMKGLPDDMFYIRDAKGHKLSVFQYPKSKTIVLKCDICDKVFYV